jgi:hypothetical protein
VLYGSGERLKRGRFNSRRVCSASTIHTFIHRPVLTSGIKHRICHLEQAHVVRLECTTAGHNKFYEFDFVRTIGHLKVIGRYGVIRQAPKETIIYG